MINSISGPPNPYRQDLIPHQKAIPRTEEIVQTSFNSKGQNPNCPMYKNPNQKDKEGNNEFDQNQVNKEFNPYCLVCSQSLCRIKSLIESGGIDPSKYDFQTPLTGTIINLEI